MTLLLSSWSKAPKGPLDLGLRLEKLEPLQMHTAAGSLPCVHPIAAFCQVGRRCWAWGLTHVLRCLQGICPSGLVALDPPVPRSSGSGAQLPSRLATAMTWKLDFAQV